MDTISSKDDSEIHRPSVKFNVIPPIPRKRTAIQVIDTTNNDNESNTDVSYHDRDMESFELLSNDQNKSLSRRNSLKSAKPSPAPRRYVQRSDSSLQMQNENKDVLLKAPIVNPRSYHKGLLGVISVTNNSPSKIPRRKSSVSTPNLANTSDMSSSSSSSPIRRNYRLSNSTDRLNATSVSTRRQRRKSSVDLGSSMIDLGVSSTHSRSSTNRISKPTILSPIVGTPNKDHEQENAQYHNDGGSYNKKYVCDSPTKIPIRRSSSVTINGLRSDKHSSHKQSNPHEASPPKQLDRSPTKIPQKIIHKSPSKVAKSMSELNKIDTSQSIPSAVNKKMSSCAKKEPSIKREKSSVKKAPPSTIKCEPSTLKRQLSNLKREKSDNNIQKNFKRENSTIGLKQMKGAIKRDQQTSKLIKNQSDSSLVKRLEKKNSFKQKRRTSSESDGLNEMNSTANISDNLISLTQKDGKSTTAIASKPVQITAAVTDHLNKSNNSGQIISINQLNDSNNNSNNLISDSNNNNINSSNNAHDQNSSQNETTTNKTVDTATNTTTTSTMKNEKKTENDNKIDLGTQTSQNPLKLHVTPDKKQTASSDPNENNVAKVDSNTPIGKLQKKASTLTLLDSNRHTDAGNIIETRTTIAENIHEKTNEAELIRTPIETNVNVIDNNLSNSAGTDDTTFKGNDIQQQQSIVATERNDMIPGPYHSNETSNNLVNDKNGVIDSSTGAKNEM